MFACLLTQILGKAEYGGGAGGDGHHFGVLLYFLQQIPGGQIAVVLALKVHCALAGFRVEGHTPVPVLLVGLCRGVALAFLGDNVHHYRVVAVLDLLKGLNQRVCVIALRLEYIIKPHSAEQVALCLAAGLAQQLQIFINAAVVLCNGHTVVVNHDDQVAVHLAGQVQPLQCLAAGQRAVADNGHHIVVLALGVPGLCQAAGQADGGGSVAQCKWVVGTLLGRAVPGNIVIPGRV